MASQQKAKASTQQHLDIEDIKEDLVLLKTGWVAMVLSTTAVNFDLLSEAEQDATIYAFGAFLNSLSFPLQVLIISKKADVTAYYQALTEAERTQPNPDLKRQIQKYKEFIQSTVQQKTVLDKNFYLIITYSPLEKGVRGVKKKNTSSKNKLENLVEAKTALAPKRDHVIKQTARLGLSTQQLTTQELIELFYNIYNPAPTGTQRVLLDSSSYTTPMVKPAVETPTPAPDVTPSLASTTEPQQSPNYAPPVSNQPPVSSPGLRPVPPQESFQTSPINQTPIPAYNPNIPPSQSDALRSLQEATAKAAELLHGVQPHQQPNVQQPQSATSTPSYVSTDSQYPGNLVKDRLDLKNKAGQDQENQ